MIFIPIHVHCWNKNKQLAFAFYSYEIEQTGTTIFAAYNGANQTNHLYT